ncbi:hypothetical protein KVT40_003188 [Elsinoe batatas]|uniref:Uncharacterized protein n=1 Tax=Elsinoe batatas TaxID=2601811 RepID=A0A8K0PJA1_9PEZI|nr:hypothetical protein KVT40_003188 [Elsinoe batatas]
MRRSTNRLNFASAALRIHRFRRPSRYCFSLSRTAARPLTTDRTTEATELKDFLHQMKLDKWGWVIYRTTYQNQKAWENAPSLLDILELSFHDDPANFDGASREQLRKHFQEWRATACIQEQPRAKIEPGIDFTTRYEYFLQIDEEALEEITRLGPSWEPLEKRAHIKLVQADWRSYYPEDEAEEQKDESHEEIDGTCVEDVGWMKVAISAIDYPFYLALADLEVWFVMYERPPALIRY